MALGSEQREVKTCAEYFKAVDEGLHAENTLDGEYEGSLLRKRCGPLWFLRNAWPSRKSYVQSYRFDVPAPLALLPANLDVEESESATIDRDEAGAQGRTLAQFHPGLVVKKKEATSLTWDDPKGSREATVDIVAWGDIDHDGLEDVLLFQWSRPKVRSMGSYYGYKHLILTRKKENGPLVVNVNPDM